ncbi:MAG: hypothetical protein COW30_04530 [Rhodospirillales bacterium CG15_BIG_FIL_POST_REV_8_21_14_020_66_15]|nr:MAG: hypothetical protein COW30_04530 [Rhodospirillales bacterium CG15_BIG_FIL_POST_REV_8_21_14_020_66_15]
MMVGRRALYIYFLSVLVVLAVGLLWEFGLEPLAFDATDPESARDRWEFMYTALGVSAVGLVVPMVLLDRGFRKEQRLLEESGEREKQFLHVFEYSPIGMALIDLDGQRFKVNHALARFMGRTLEELENTSMQSTAADDDLLRKSQKLRQQVIDGDLDSYTNERSYLHKDGRIVWGEVTASLLRDEAGRPLYFVAHTLDITERKAHDEALKKSEARLRGAIDSLQEGFALYDPEDRLIAVNAKYVEIWPHARDMLERGGTFEEMIRANVAQGLIAEAVGREEEFIRARLAQHHKTSINIERQFTDGRWYRIEEAPTPEGGTAMSFIDITELKRADEARRIALHNAEQSSRTKSEFLATVSHELRTPLNAILGFSEVLGSEYAGPVSAEKNKEYADYIHGSAQHLLALVNDLLDISTIEAGKRDLTRALISATDVIDDCLQAFDPAMASKRISFERQVSQGLPDIFVDPRAFKQVLLNLLSNAVKYTPDGGTIILQASKVRKMLSVSVADTGKGIPEDLLPDITDPFTRGLRDPYRTEKGWGLGLSITKSLVEMHGGRLKIESRVDHGTTVTVLLPIEDDPLARVAAGQTR